MLGLSAQPAKSTTGLALLLAPAGVRGNIPVVPAWVSNGSRPFAVLHVTHVVKAYSSSLEGSRIGSVHVANKEMDG